MNEATAVTEAKHPSALDRRGEARHTDKRLRCREVHDLEPIQPFERLERCPPLHGDSRGKLSQVDVDTAGVFLDHSTESSSDKRGRWSKVLRPHLLDVSIAQSPTIVGARRQGDNVQGRGIRFMLLGGERARNHPLRNDNAATEDSSPTKWRPRSAHTAGSRDLPSTEPLHAPQQTMAAHCQRG